MKNDYDYIKEEFKDIILKLNISWKMFIVSDFDDAVNMLKLSIGKINEIAEISHKDRMQININSKKISSKLVKINKCLSNNQYVEAADIVKYELLKSLQQN